MSSSGSTTRICRVTFCEKYTRVLFHQALNFAVLPSPVTSRVAPLHACPWQSLKVMIFIMANPALEPTTIWALVSINELSCLPTSKRLVRSSVPKLEFARRWAASFCS